MANRAELGTQVACTVCAMAPLCHSRAALAGGCPPVEGRRRLEPGARLYAAGWPRTAVYALRAGFLRIDAPDASGGSHIVRLLLPGDAAGLDAFATGVHQSEAVALDDCEVCQIPVHRVDLLADSNAAVRMHLRSVLARELGFAQSHAAALARLTARQRVAGFLLELARRWSERGFSGTRFRLPLGRREIGEHLGLTMETVSRVLSAFRTQGWIRLPHRQVEILAPEMLRAVVSGTTTPD